MNIFKPESLRRNLVLTFIWLWVVSALAATLVAFWLAGRSAQISFDRILKDDALALATQLDWDPLGPVFAADTHTADYLIFDSLSPSRFMVINQNGKKLIGNALLTLPPSADQQKAGVPLFFDSDTDNGSLRVVAIRMENKQSRGYAWVVVGESQAKRNQISKELAAAIFLPAIGLAVFIVPLLFAGIRYGLAPANAINDAVSLRGIDDLSAIPLSQVPVELRGLISHINDLLQRLQEAIAHERRFISDAAHQLRTPLAGIKLLVDDLMRTTQASPSAPPDQEVLSELSKASARVTQLVKQLLTLARSEGVNSIEMSAIELGSFVNDIKNQWEPIFSKSSKEFNLTLDPIALGEIQFKTNATLLKEILTNLIDNAFNYGGMTVNFKLNLHEQSVLFKVRDSGEGVWAGDIEKMLTPFWRGQDHSQHGVGLGLPIAQKTCSLLGGTLSIQVRPEVEGTQVTVKLPL
jgi:two-component system sensor histidine kinase TctE